MRIGKILSISLSFLAICSGLPKTETILSDLSQEGNSLAELRQFKLRLCNNMDQLCKNIYDTLYPRTRARRLGTIAEVAILNAWTL
jgi:hypothetical protein